MSKTNEKVIAILCADIHLSMKAPLWRSAEDDWFAAMQRPLDELRELQVEQDCPILCAGDIFDKWNSPPELINFALEYLLDNMYCIPGQHDLPDHNYNEIHRSAYWTLVKAGKIKNFREGSAFGGLDKLKVYGFPFGSKLTALPSFAKDDRLQVAMIHEYTWVVGRSYPNAPEKNRLKKQISDLGYDVIIFGDNHYSFSGISKNMSFFNCGCLMRRKSDEKHYAPQVGLLLESGEIKQHFLSTLKDKFLASVDDSTAIEELDIEEFLEELKKLGDTSLEFLEAVKQFFRKHKTLKAVREILLKAGE